MKLHLLVVEDSQPVLDQWKQKLEFYAVEDDPVYAIEYHPATELDEVEKLLLNTKFDAAVIDIRLDENGTQTDHGNEILKILSESSLAVCAVYTGEPGTEIIPDHQKEFVKVFKKGDGDGIEKVLSWLDEKANMISAIKTMQESFNESMAQAFTRSIWPRWGYWLRNNEDLDFAQKALTRHMATHLHASFLSDVELGTHPEEYFFIPPLQENLDTGDIILTDDKLEIIVTPRCDMVRKKSEKPTYQLVALQDKSDKWNELKKDLAFRKTTGNSKKIESALSNIRKFTNHNGETGGHFIQSFRLNKEDSEIPYGPFYAQFNQLRSIDRNEENTLFLLERRIASLSNEFIPSLVERLGAYFSRIGSPDYSHPE